MGCYIKIFWIFFLIANPFGVYGQTDFEKEYSINIESIPGNSINIGDSLRFKGQLTKLNGQMDIKCLGVEDPITQKSVKIVIDSTGFFEYKITTNSESPGTYCFAFLIPSQNENVFKVYYTVSIEPDCFDNLDQLYIPLKDVEISLGYLGSEIDETTDLISKKALNRIASKNQYSPSTLSFYAESFGEAALDYGKKYVETLNSSPTNKIVLIGASAICLGSGFTMCAPVFGIVIKNLITTSFDLDIEYLVDQSTLDVETKNKVKFWTKLGTKSVLTVTGFSSTPDGPAGFLSGFNMGGKWAELLSKEISPELKNIRYDSRGNVLDYTLNVRLNDGSIISYMASTLDNEISTFNAPETFKYFDTEIMLLNGNKQTGNVISGQFQGIEYGLSTSTSSNFIKFVNEDGTIQLIPTYEIAGINRLKLEIIELNSRNVKLNMGNKNGIKPDQVYQVYESTLDILNTPQEIIHGNLQITEVGDDSSSGFIVNQFRRGISIGDFCR